MLVTSRHWSPQAWLRDERFLFRAGLGGTRTRALHLHASTFQASKRLVPLPVLPSTTSRGSDAREKLPSFDVLVELPHELPQNPFRQSDTRAQRGISPHASHDGVHSSSVPSMRRDHLSIFITIASVPGYSTVHTTDRTDGSARNG